MWREQTGSSITSFSATCWWSRWEVTDQLLVQYGDVPLFLHWEDVDSRVTRANLLDIVTQPQKTAMLELELAAIVGWGRPFVTATYTLEGDDPLAFECYEVVSTVSVAIQAAYTPNLLAVARKLAGGVAQVQQQYLDYAQSCVQPRIDYLNMQLSSNFLSAFKAARLFSAQINAVMQPDSGVIDSLSAFLFFDSPVILANSLILHKLLMWIRILDVLIGGSCIALYSHTGQLLPARYYLFSRHPQLLNEPSPF